MTRGSLRRGRGICRAVFMDQSRAANGAKGLFGSKLRGRLRRLRPFKIFLNLSAGILGRDRDLGAQRLVRFGWLLSQDSVLLGWLSTPVALSL